MGGRWLASRNDRYRDRISAEVERLGWTVAPGDDVSAVFTGRAGDGSEFAIHASLFDDGDGTPDRLEWRAGRAWLDAIVLAITNDGRDERDWLAGIQIPFPGLAHDDPDRSALVPALDALAATGASRAELNEYALAHGAGGSDGVVLRFRKSAVEIESDLPASGRRVQVLAVSPEAAAHILTDGVGDALAVLLGHATSYVGPTLQAFAGVPFCKVWIETRWTTVDVLQDLAACGIELRARTLTWRDDVTAPA